MSELILFNKPFRVLSQFTDRDNLENPRATLSDYLDAEVVAPFTIELAADGAEGFNATVVGEAASVRVRQDRFLEVVRVA